MIAVGFFSEMNTCYDNGSIKENVSDTINYDKRKIICYLKSFKKKAICPRNAIDCFTGEIISPSFSIYDDGEFCWSDFLFYHIQQYNIKLPYKLINKANANIIK